MKQVLPRSDRDMIDSDRARRALAVSQVFENHVDLGTAQRYEWSVRPPV